jgi:hypothetical protein
LAGLIAADNLNPTQRAEGLHPGRSYKVAAGFWQLGRQGTQKAVVTGAQISTPLKAKPTIHRNRAQTLSQAFRKDKKT